LFLALASCKEPEPIDPRPQPEPEPSVSYACPKDADIYKIFPDTFLVNEKGIYIKLNDGLRRLRYDDASSVSFALFTCDGKIHDRNKAINSPLSWEIKRGSAGRDTIYATAGGIRLNQLLLTKDVDKILTFKDGEKIGYDVALLNFNQDTIQANTITFIYKKDL
jgi:hypothetical protein